jgi:hypothetical protein
LRETLHVSPWRGGTNRMMRFAVKSRFFRVILLVVSLAAVGGANVKWDW